ncbi:MAG: hypothetical protein ACO34E_06025 [Limisphaerales bacterium]
MNTQNHSLASITLDDQIDSAVLILLFTCAVASIPASILHVWLW